MARVVRHTATFGADRHTARFDAARHTATFGGPGDLFEAATGFCFLINGVDELLINATDCLLINATDFLEINNG